jgi:hypothetical protein
VGQHILTTDNTPCNPTPISIKKWKTVAKKLFRLYSSKMNITNLLLQLLSKLHIKFKGVITHYRYVLRMKDVHTVKTDDTPEDYVQ